ncbi:glycine zipper 2TM domain-containing protein [Xanthomonas cucurbitae]|uniref:Glycine zipper 2TM domain-containing protein n=1 Tax=Xanthomonas cucurbitae TaxID=56453 RepID=A0ABY7YAR9_9XANT|nr:glycine zipper 2TM domain-containing protein [Xanthomonas cucurbitae]QHG88219.1 glycine zipper 2TM domain-containing protein [Xanthomonas cucurbitae]WDM67086.1 glycine zipper 2TM domain-containing protein [Xanthomonas cucurbitae]WDM70964.1 glycine zipper 2TM domain-containing protein [Xanthomonas cucurbitae]WDM74785.1 glycine zipper 2TM domain-containing protein [Xanthomonas cucurbitae]
MNIQTSLLGLTMIGLMATSSLAQAQRYSHQDSYTEADEGRKFSDGTRVRCRNVEVQQNSTDPNRIGGTLAGAAIGGLLGNQVGGGNGKKLATVAGAVAGGAAGRTIQGNRQQANGNRRVERVCERR